MNLRAQCDLKTCWLFTEEILWFSQVKSQIRENHFSGFILSRAAAWHGPATVRNGATISALAKCSLRDHNVLLFWKPPVNELRGALPEKVSWEPGRGAGDGLIPSPCCSGQAKSWVFSGLPPNPEREQQTGDPVRIDVPASS